jgi:hypothetical protein
MAPADLSRRVRVSPEDITALVQQISSPISDPATGTLLITGGSRAGMTVPYQGARDDYSIALAGDSLIEAFGDLAAGKHTASTTFLLVTRIAPGQC